MSLDGELPYSPLLLLEKLSRSARTRPAAIPALAAAADTAWASRRRSLFVNCVKRRRLGVPVAGVLMGSRARARASSSSRAWLLVGQAMWVVRLPSGVQHATANSAERHVRLLQLLHLVLELFLLAGQRSLVLSSHFLDQGCVLGF